MERKRAQIAVEYLMLTGFIMVAVAIIFTFAFLNYGQNIRIAKASEAMAKIENAVNDVYARGQGNNSFIQLSLPEGMTDLRVMHKCIEESSSTQGSLEQCETGCTGEGYDCIEFSAIVMTLNLTGGESTLLRETRAKIYADTATSSLGEMSEKDDSGNYNKYAGSLYTAKVSWLDGEKIAIEKV